MDKDFDIMRPLHFVVEWIIFVPSVPIDSSRLGVGRGTEKPKNRTEYPKTRTEPKPKFEDF